MGTSDAFSANMGNKNGKPVLRDEDIATLTKSSGLDEAQVKSSFDDFIEKYPDGKIRPKVFHVNGDGSITMTEMTKLTKDMCGMLKAEDPNIAAKEMIAKSAFAEMDKDKDGKVTLDEFINACMGQEEFSRMLTLKLLDIFVE